MSQTDSPVSPTQSSAPMSVTESLPVQGEQAASQPATEDVSIGHQMTLSPAAAAAAQESLSAPDLGAQKNALVKTVRITTQGWDAGSRFADAEHFWAQLEDEVSAVYLNCYMYPNVKTIHVTILGLEEAYLPAGAPATFAVAYHTGTDTAYIAAVEDRDKPEADQHQQQQQANTDDAATSNGRKRDLVVRIDINPVFADDDDDDDDDQHKKLDWMPVFAKEAVECEDAYLDSPEFHHRLVWEIVHMTFEETLWKPSARSTPIVVGNLKLMTGPADD
ncbi:hypothetical protein LY78DRAFT_676461 [Colletotrichum sublineola]|nr:hypothetical protein LY78DRAFT_676461 [Colletotrichum sublineola]